MTSNSWLFANDVSHSGTSLTIQKRTEEIAAEMFARSEKRRLAFEQLKSVLYSPAERIGAWEKLYGLRLPSDSSHPILSSIARTTELTLAQVLDEQKNRSAQTGKSAASLNV